MSYAEHWTEVAKDLNASYTELAEDEDFLRRGQRRQWRKDEQEVFRENSSLRVKTLRTLIAFRAEETAERCAGMAVVHPSLGNKLAQQYGSFELGQRSKRRARREQLEAMEQAMDNYDASIAEEEDARRQVRGGVGMPWS